MSILITYGTRPEFIKILPLLRELDKSDIKYKVLFTGQHQNLIKNFESDYTIDIVDGLNRLDSIVQSVMNTIPSIMMLDTTTFTHVMVQGDTTTALAVALSAYNNGLKIIHLEAGLRTYDKDNPYPEEVNRRIISQIADIHLCPTIDNKQNLFNEQIRSNVFVVGNTVIDNLKDHINKCEYTNKILITLHRRENHHWLDQWFNKLNELAKKYNNFEFILPIHPNPNVQKHKNLLTHINVIDPLPYDEMINLLVKTRLVITDSGGLQEECSYFNKKCLVCRVVTERLESLHRSSYIVKSPDNLIDVFDKHIADYEIDHKCPYGDGNVSQKIVGVLKKII